MDRTRQASRSHHPVRALAPWAASGVFTAWAAAWPARGDQLGYVMILMYLLAITCTVTVMTKIGAATEIRREQAEREIRADQILKAVSDMAEVLASARLSAGGEAGLPHQPAAPADPDVRLRLVVPEEDLE